MPEKEALIVFKTIDKQKWVHLHNNRNILCLLPIQGESKKPDTFDIQMNNKGVSFFWLTLYSTSEICRANILSHKLSAGTN
jgi:hypothetical protein